MLSIELLDKVQKKHTIDGPNDTEVESFIDVDRLLSQNEITIESFDNTTKDTGVKVSKACNKKSVQGTSSTQGKKRKLSVVDEELEIIKGALDNVAKQ